MNTNLQEWAYTIIGSMIKYKELDTMMEKIDITRNLVTIHIDLHAVLFRIFKKENAIRLIHADSDNAVRVLVVNTLNLAAHYRYYYRTRYGLPVNVLLYYNKTAPKFQTTMIPEYMSDIYDKYDTNNVDGKGFQSIISATLRFAKSIVDYIEGVYIVDTDDIDITTAMYTMIKDRYHQAHNVILSRNPIGVQLIDKHTTYVHLRRGASKLVYGKKVYHNSILVGDDTDSMNIDLAPMHIRLVLALCGHPDLNIPKTFIRGRKTAVQYVNDMNRNVELDPHISITRFIQAIENHIKMYPANSKTNKLDKLRNSSKQIELNHNVTDLRIPYAALSATHKATLYTRMVDMYDQYALEKLNDSLINIDPSYMIHIKELIS